MQYDVSKFIVGKSSRSSLLEPRLVVQATACIDGTIGKGREVLSDVAFCHTSYTQYSMLVLYIIYAMHERNARTKRYCFPLPMLPLGAR